MVEATDKIGIGGGHLGQLFELEIASIKQQQGVWLGLCHHGIDILLVRNVPGHEGKMGEDTMFVIPHELHLCPSLCGTAAGTRKRGFETIWEAKACTSRDVHPGKRRKKHSSPT
jgi:hypothetical protein